MQTAFVVIGGLNTDLIGQGLERLAKPGELVTGQALRIGPGGKSRNIAQMIAALADAPGAVAMVGRTCEDPYGLWSAPMQALRNAGVDTSHVAVVPYDGTLPGIAMIPVSQDGQNQIYVFPGMNALFSPEDIQRAESAFTTAASQNGILAFSLELPISTAFAAVETAKRLGMRIFVDPGGIADVAAIEPLLKSGITLLKPNEHETEMLVGVRVHDEKSAHEAGKRLMEFGIPSVLITAGEHGAYAIDHEGIEHILLPNIPVADVRDATGCGDQAMAAMCFAMQQGMPFREACRMAVLAATMQFGRVGIQPVTAQQLRAAHS
jgi:ribokinase